MHHAEMSLPAGKKLGSVEKIIPVSLLLQQGPLPDKCTFLVQGFLFFQREMSYSLTVLDSLTASDIKKELYFSELVSLTQQEQRD